MLKKATEATLPKKRPLSEVEGQQGFHLVSFGQDENLIITSSIFYKILKLIEDIIFIFICKKHIFK